jgi:hypothetical protein
MEDKEMETITKRKYAKSGYGRTCPFCAIGTVIKSGKMEETTKLGVSLMKKCHCTCGRTWIEYFVTTLTDVISYDGENCK